MNSQAEAPADTAAHGLEDVLTTAAGAAPALAASAHAERAGWLRAVADRLDAATDELVPAAIGESHLPEARLGGEVARSTGQLRMFADALESGALLEVVIDTADPDAKPVPRPDLRRMLVPVGPVVSRKNAAVTSSSGGPGGSVLRRSGPCLKANRVCGPAVTRTVPVCRSTSSVVNGPTA